LKRNQIEGNDAIIGKLVYGGLIKANIL